MSRTCQEEDWASGGLRSCGGQVFNIVELDILENVKHSRDRIALYITFSQFEQQCGCFERS